MGRWATAGGRRIDCLPSDTQVAHGFEVGRLRSAEKIIAEPGLRGRPA